MAGKQGAKQNIKEPSIVIKPIGRFGGLDGIHVALAVLVVILVALLALVAYTQPAYLVPSNSSNSLAYNSVHNASQIKLVAERYIAAYRNTNSSLSLLPYYTNVSGMNASYSPQSHYWYVRAPFLNPITKQTIYISLYINDKNTSLVMPFLQTSGVSSFGSDHIVSSGVIQLQGRAACTSSNQVNVYWFTDPYAPGAIQTLGNATALQGRFGSHVNVSMEILFTSYTQQIGSTQGLANAEALGQYIFCASRQPNFSGFVANLQSRYTGAYISPSTMNAIASSSNLNLAQMNACISNSTAPLNNQQYFGAFYNITTTPAVITNCEYLSIPQTASSAVCLTNSSLC